MNNLNTAIEEEEEEVNLEEEGEMNNRRKTKIIPTNKNRKRWT